ncbi:hypothetical protein SAMN05444359_11998 [Neolewinella agarilytica]|uniref:Uncharacterized protein n=1 Tax=Neolewinella agarilytica TaxID=478744 RepID=A0A1H9K563_9BACT|nr:hypothetical protein SAMN05444359_11998 [Neolewinella agarilytica]
MEADTAVEAMFFPCSLILACTRVRAKLPFPFSALPPLLLSPLVPKSRMLIEKTSQGDS